MICLLMNREFTPKICIPRNKIFMYLQMVTQRSFCQSKFVVRNYFARCIAVQNDDKINERYFSEAVEDPKSFDLENHRSQAYFTGDDYRTSRRVIRFVERNPRTTINLLPKHRAESKRKSWRMKAKPFTQQP